MTNCTCACILEDWLICPQEIKELIMFLLTDINFTRTTVVEFPSLESQFGYLIILKLHVTYFHRLRKPNPKLPKVVLFCTWNVFASELVVLIPLTRTLNTVSSTIAARKAQLDISHDIKCKRIKPISRTVYTRQIRKLLSEGLKLSGTSSNIPFGERFSSF